MVLERIVKEENDKVDNRATIDKNLIAYFAGMIESNYDEFSEAFYDMIEDKFKENMKYLHDEIEKNGFDETKKYFFERTLYHETTSMIRKLNDDAVRLTGMTIYDNKINTPDIQLGLSEYFEFSGIGSTGKRLSEKGKSVVNEYRKVGGLNSIDESREHGNKILEKMSNIQKDMY